MMMTRWSTDGICLAQDDIRWHAFVNSVMNIVLLASWGLSQPTEGPPTSRGPLSVIKVVSTYFACFKFTRCFIGIVFCFR
jgi:hypothetical protein